MRKLMTLGLLGLFAIIFGMGFNIVAHETGHYVVAEIYGYNPEMHFNTPLTNESKTFEIDTAVAYVSYSSFTADIVREDAYIAFAGPLVNLILGIIFTVVYIIRPNKDDFPSLILLIFVITSLVAGLSNLYPAGSSDGLVILNYLRNV